jgi:hypothetical protein
VLLRDYGGRGRQSGIVVTQEFCSRENHDEDESDGRSEK